MDAKIMLIAIMVSFVLLLGCTQGGSQAQDGNGRIVLGIKDAAANMGSVSSVMVTINGVQMQNEGDGWTTLSSTAQTYDLMELKADGSTALLADMQVPEGRYRQVRLHISQVVVTDANGTHQAKLPSGELRITGNFNVTANSTTTATFDFIADESLHMTGNGLYILAPVIKVETREGATADVDFRKNVKIWGGEIKSSVRIGMDIDGDVGEGRKIGPGEIISIMDDGKIVKSAQNNAGGNGKGRVVVGITDAADSVSVTGVLVTVDSVQMHSETNGWATLSSTAQTYDLLELDAQDRTALLADLQLPSGTYQQIRLHISQVAVTDANGTRMAKLPSGELKIVGIMEVEENSTTTATIDFVAVESLFRASNGGYVFAPVVKFETRQDAMAEVANDGTVAINGGRIRTSSRIGMDIDGNTGEGLKIASGRILDIGEIYN